MPITTKPAEYYGHQFITRKIFTSFMDWLSRHLYIERYDENGLVYRYIQVPVQYAQRERFVEIIKSVSHQDGNNENVKIDINRVLPRMSVNMVSMNYGQEYKLNKYIKVRAKSFDGAEGKLITIPAPVPYTIDLEVAIISKTTDDNLQIIEQLIPYFNPTFSLDLNILPGFESVSVPFTLTSIAPDANEEFGVDDERVFITTMSFTTVANYYYISRNDEIIKKIILNYHLADKDDTFAKFEIYQMTADNLTPVTTIVERDLEPTTTTINIVKFFHGVAAAISNSTSDINI